jgi:hypothetical protein
MDYFATVPSAKHFTQSAVHQKVYLIPLEE